MSLSTPGFPRPLRIWPDYFLVCGTSAAAADSITLSSRSSNSSCSDSTIFSGSLGFPMLTSSAPSLYSSFHTSSSNQSTSPHVHPNQESLLTDYICDICLNQSSLQLLLLLSLLDSLSSTGFGLQCCLSVLIFGFLTVTE